MYALIAIGIPNTTPKIVQPKRDCSKLNSEAGNGVRGRTTNVMANPTNGPYKRPTMYLLKERNLTFGKIKKKNNVQI